MRWKAHYETIEDSPEGDDGVWIAHYQGRWHVDSQEDDYYIHLPRNWLFIRWRIS